MIQKGKRTATLNASLNSKALLESVYPVKIDAPLVHTYIPLKKQSFEKAWHRYHQEIEQFLPNRFRSQDDLNVATFLVPWLMYLEKESASTQEICYYFNIRSPNGPTQYKKLLENKKEGKEPHSFCANDFNSGKTIGDYKAKLEKMLKEYYSINKTR